MYQADPNSLKQESWCNTKQHVPLVVTSHKDYYHILYKSNV